MKKFAKIVGMVLGALAALVLLFVGWVQLGWSLERADTPLPTLEASTDPGIIARGEYLVHAVAHCSTCHGPADKLKTLQLDPSAPLSGGYDWDIGPFGHFFAPNITPHPDGIGKMSDPELARTIRHAVGRDGNLVPFMLLAVGPMADGDVVAIMSWLRAQPAVAGKHPKDEYRFLAKMLSGKFQPRLAPPPAHVAEGGVSVERGRYLAEGPAMCKGCHTAADPMQGFAFVGDAYAGAAEADPDPTDAKFEIVAPNLTRDEQTGITAKWDEDRFVQRFAAGRVLRGSKMPWEAFRRMTEDDVRSVFRYLRSLPPVKNDVGPARRQVGSFSP